MRDSDTKLEIYAHSSNWEAPQIIISFLFVTLTNTVIVLSFSNYNKICRCYATGSLSFTPFWRLRVWNTFSHEGGRLMNKYRMWKSTPISFPKYVRLLYRTAILSIWPPLQYLIVDICAKCLHQMRFGGLIIFVHRPVAVLKVLHRITRYEFGRLLSRWFVIKYSLFI